MLVDLFEPVCFLGKSISNIIKVHLASEFQNLYKTTKGLTYFKNNLVRLAISIII